MIGLSSFYRRGVVHYLIVVFYLCGDVSDKQKIFNQNISNYAHYVEELYNIIFPFQKKNQIILLKEKIKYYLFINN